MVPVSAAAACASAASPTVPRRPRQVEHEQGIASMRSSKVIHVISCHAEGEVGDVIVGGVAPPPGETLWEQRSHIATDQSLRNFMLNEPRGGVFRHVNLLVPPKDPRATMGFIIMEP